MRNRKTVEKTNKKIIKLYKKGSLIKNICKEVGLEKSQVWRVLTRYNKSLEINNQPKKTHTYLLKKRNEKIIRLAKTGMTSKSIGAMFNLTSTSIGTICKANKVNTIKIRREKLKAKYQKILNKINHKAKSGLCSVDVYRMYITNARDYRQLARFGLKKISNFRIKRNAKIAKSYKGGKTASSILNSGVCGIKSIPGVYHVIRKEKVKKYPKVIRRLGVYNTSKRALNLIGKLRKQNLSHANIAIKLNDMNLTTACGKQFTSSTVQYGLKVIEKINNKRALVKKISEAVIKTPQITPIVVPTVHTVPQNISVKKEKKSSFFSKLKWW